MENKKQKTIENRLAGELHNMISEFKYGGLSEETILSYFSQFLRDAGVDSEIVVNVLQRPVFGEGGKYEATAIKVNEGW